jgi:solute carrier family 25 protein 39/40
LSNARERARVNILASDMSLSSKLQQAEKSHSSTFVDSFAAGAVSGAISALVTTPFDVGKTKQQVYRHAGDDLSSLTEVQKAAKLTGKKAPEEMTMPRFLYHIYKEQGVSGLFKGWGPRCLKVAPACAIMISSYELGKKWAAGASKKNDEKSGSI